MLVEYCHPLTRRVSFKYNICVSLAVSPFTVTQAEPQLIRKPECDEMDPLNIDNSECSTSNTPNSTSFPLNTLLSANTNGSSR